MNFKQLSKGIFSVESFLDPSECEGLIKRIEATGFEQASISTSAGTQLDKDTRNNDRVIIDDVDLANDLWSRIQQFTPRVLLGRQARGLNE